VPSDCGFPTNAVANVHGALADKVSLMSACQRRTFSTLSMGSETQLQKDEFGDGNHNANSINASQIAGQNHLYKALSPVGTGLFVEEAAYLHM